MRISYFLFFIGILQTQATNTYAQETSLTIHENSIELEKLFKKIEAQTDFYFFYSNDKIDKSIKVNINVENKTIYEILNVVLKNTNIIYQVKNKAIILNLDKDLKHLQQSQQPSRKKITGTVVDEQGIPITGASIAEKGTTNGVMTDADGGFTISVSENAIILVSFVGYIAQEIAVGNQTELNILLRENLNILDEVVVVGFGTQKKVNLTGSVSTIDSKMLENRPVMTAAQALQGAAAGLQITQNSGSMESRASINIRGVATIGEGSSGSPLILIDGMEGDINAINPQDIENISVLKDAAASSIYGSRAPFGVILVTTKKGRNGKATLNYNNSFRWTSPMLLPKTADSYTFALFLNDGCINGGTTPFSQMIRYREY